MASNASLKFVSHRGALGPHSLCFHGGHLSMSGHESSLTTGIDDILFHTILTDCIGRRGHNRESKRTVGRWEMHFRHGESKMGECNRTVIPSSLSARCCPMGTAVSSPEKETGVFVNDCCAPAELSLHPDSLEPFHPPRPPYTSHVRKYLPSREVPSKSFHYTQGFQRILYRLYSIRGFSEKIAVDVIFSGQGASDAKRSFNLVTPEIAFSC